MSKKPVVCGPAGLRNPLRGCGDFPEPVPLRREIPGGDRQQFHRHHGRRLQQPVGCRQASSSGWRIFETEDLRSSTPMSRMTTETSRPDTYSMRQIFSLDRRKKHGFTVSQTFHQGTERREGPCGPAGLRNPLRGCGDFKFQNTGIRYGRYCVESVFSV